MPNRQFIASAFFLFLSLSVQGQTAAEWKKSGDEKIETQEYDSAHFYFDQAIADYANQDLLDSSMMLNSQKALVLHLQKKSEEALGLLDTKVEESNKNNLSDEVILTLMLRKAQIASQLFNLDDTEAILAEMQVYVDTTSNISVLEAEYLMEVAWIKMRRYKMAEALIDSKQAYWAISKHLGDDHKKVSSFLQLTSYLYSQLYQLDSAEVYTKKYVDNALAIFPKDHFYRGLAFNQLGTLYMSMRNFDQAIAAHKRSERIGRIMNRKGDSRLLGVNCNNLALTYTLCGEHDLALNYAVESLKMNEKSYGENSVALRSTLTNLSDIYLAIGDYDMAFTHAKAAYDNQLKNEPEDKSSLAYTQNFLANAMTKVGRSDEAKDLLYANLSTFNDASFGATAYALGTYLHLGNIHLEEENADSAYYYHQYILRQNQKELANFHLENIRQYAKLAQARAIVDLNSAHLHLDTAAAYLAQRETPEAHFVSMIPDFTPDVIGVEMCLSKMEFLWRQFQETSDPIMLDDLKLCVDTYLHYLSNYLGVIRGEHSMNKISELNAQILQYALLACRAQEKRGLAVQEDLVRYTELGRDVLFKLFSSHFQVNSMVGVPNKIISTNQKLAADIRVAKEDLQYALQKDSLANMHPLSSAIESYQSFKEKIKKEYPVYFARQFELATPDLANIQEALSPEESFIQYTFIEDELLALIISKKQFHHKWIEAKDLKANINKFLTAVKSQQFSKTAAQDLYTQLIKPVAPLLQTQKLVIIPDDLLHYLNFEMLVADQGTNRFLIEEHSIVYASSFAQYLSKHSPAHFSNRKNNQLAFAPGFSTGNKESYKLTTDTLSWDQEYLSMLQQPFTVKFGEALSLKNYISFLNENANEHNFKQRAPSARLLFIGTHGLLNDLNPAQSFLQFSKPMDSTKTEDGRLYASEIYGLPLNASLALLTACNTGIGEYRRGAGMLSLAHAFNSAGCQNIVHSLWEIDEASSIALGKSFLEYYEKGSTPTAALRQAKLDYLQTAEGELANPYYWGGMVLKGTAEPGKTRNWWLWGGGILVILGMGYWKWG